MPDPAWPPPVYESETRSGTMGALARLLGSIGTHIQALLSLAGCESKEAGGLYLRVIIFVVVALVCAIFGYVFLLLFVAFLLAAVLGINWLWISLLLALLHFIATVVCAMQVKTRIQTPVFAATMAELRKDFQSLSDFQS